MNFKEAMEKYAIPIPEDIENYDKEKYREFDNMYLESFYYTFYSKEEARSKDNSENDNKVAVVLGGQAGAGKSSLVADTKREFRDEGRRIVLIDDDQYRKLYPYSQEILKECPEFYTRITATATNKITPKILKFASENGYNFIFDGTMKNERIVNTMKSWEDYQIQVKVMATSRLRSIVGATIRNGELRTLGEEGRFITVETHDGTYYGIPDTLRYLESLGMADEIKIYTRGNNPLFPKQQYSSLETPEISSADKLEELRKKDEIDFLEHADENIEYLERTAVNLSETEQTEIYRIIEMIKEQVKAKESKDDVDR